jgi:hypothetical protein
VKEMKNILPPRTPDAVTRVQHLLLLEECNGMWDVIPISRAINYLHENPPPTEMNEEELGAYEDAIPFDVGSDEWCFTILIMRKKTHNIVGRSMIYDLEGDGPGYSLLLKDQGPKDALRENGIVCGHCLNTSPSHRCSKCKILKYCSRECQSSNWEKHKKQCRKERLKKSSDDDSREARMRWVDENGSAILFVRRHVYPMYQDMPRYIGSIPAFYTESVHALFKRVYEKVGTNVYTVYGKELGETLFQDHGGLATLRAADSIIPKVIQNFPLTTNNQQVEMQQKMVAEVLARRLLDWDGIGGYWS